MSSSMLWKKKNWLKNVLKSTITAFIEIHFLLNNGIRITDEKKQKEICYNNVVNIELCRYIIKTL